jgi:PAS domain S-box-containing protein
VRREERAPAVRYGLAAAVCAAALGVNLLLAPFVQANTFPLFLAAVMIATWHGGLGPGLLAAGLTAVANDYFFFAPRTLFELTDASLLVRELLYVLSAVLIVGLGTLFRGAQVRAAAAAAEAERTAASLRESDRNFRALVEGVREYSIVMLDVEGRVVMWSPGAARIFGYTEAEIVGRHVAMLYPPDAETSAELFAATAQRGRVETQGWRVRKDGTRFFAEVAVTASRDASGALAGYWAISRDITERMQAEEALRGSEARFRKLLELAPDAIIIVNHDGRMVLVNSQAQKLFGYTEDEMLGQPVEILMPDTVRGTHVHHRATYAEAPRTRPMAIGLDLAGRRKDGTHVPVEISLSPMPAEDGLLVMSAIRDVTDRRAAEARITSLNADLERRVAELAAVNKELESFSYSVSHDLRAPLRSIDGFSQALLEEYGDVLTGDGQDYLRRVRAATQRMGDLIDDLLNLSRVTRREMRHEPIDLTALARLVVAQLQRAEPEREVEVTIQPDLVAWGDSHLVRLALENLLGNAWKFTSKQPAPRIELGATRMNGETVFHVRDNGVGFDMAYSFKLFGAFQRLHAATEFPGTGIGLATVQRVVARHGGRVWAEADIGKGATFYFTL